MNNVICFDIETVADVESYQRIKNVVGSPEEIYQIMISERLTEAGTTFLRPQWHKVVSIAFAARLNNSFYVSALNFTFEGLTNHSEKALLERFFGAIKRYTPTLVSWNGSGFDLPILHYRALKYGVNAERYFENGDHDKDFNYNNYLSRYHKRHIDLMDVLSLYNPKNVISLDDAAKLCGFAGKIGSDGGAVQERFFANDLDGISHYCETDALNTYLIYLRFEQMRGNLSPQLYDERINEVKVFLEKNSSSPTWKEFLEASTL